jgi:hypothetical protein
MPSPCAASSAGSKRHELSAIRTHHVSTYVEVLTRTYKAPTVKQHLAAIRMLFDWLIVGQVVGQNPAAAVRGPKHVVKKGKTPVLGSQQCGTVPHAIPQSHRELRIVEDRVIDSAISITIAPPVPTQSRRCQLPATQFHTSDRISSGQQSEPVPPR